MRRKYTPTSVFYCMESVERRIFLSASPSALIAGSTLKPGISKPTAAQISTMLKQAVSDPVAFPTQFGLVDQAGVSSASATGVYSAAQFNKTYGIDSVQNDGGTGAGETIAIIDAYDDTTITADMKTFDAQMGLPDFYDGINSSTNHFWIVGENGGAPTTNAPPAGQNVVETALDVEWAHAVAPQANILLVECDALTNGDLIQNGVAWVETQTTYPNVCAVSMSFGEEDNAPAESLDNLFSTPAGHTGITFLASTGDTGAFAFDDDTGTNVLSPEWPAVAPNVLAIGGTTLSSDASITTFNEIGWGSGTAPLIDGTGGGISTIETQPTYQIGTVGQSTTSRTIPDVSLDADPNTGVAVADAQDEGAGTPWLGVGGTSLAAPAWAGIIAIVDQQRAANGLGALDGATQTLPMLYGLSSGDFHDITVGNNGVYDATAGYDLVTGRGTPIANKLINDLSGVTTPAAVDLTFSTPNGWQSPLVVTPTSGDRIDGNFVDGSSLFVDWNGINAGVLATSTTFHSQLLVDGVVKQTLTTSAPLANGATFGATDFSIGSLSAGTHTISVKVNYLNEQGENNTANNIYTRTITVVATTAPDLIPAGLAGWSAPVVVTNVSGGITDTTLTTSDTIYIDFGIGNIGAATSPQFFLQLSLNGNLFAVFIAPAIGNFQVASLRGLSIGSLAAGTYTIGFLNNYNGVSSETDYFNDNFTKTFTVLGTTGTITGTVYQDTNADGLFNGSDSGLAGQTVYLDLNSDGQLDDADLYTTTTAGGAFTFSSVPVGNYTLREAPGEYIETTPAAKSFSISLSSGQTQSGSTFGDFPIAYLGTNSADNYTVQLDAAGTTLQILLGGTLIDSAPKSLVTTPLAFLSGAGNDTLLVNAANGNPILSGGIFYNGGIYITADTLQFNGTSGADSITANSSQLFFGASPITYMLTPAIVVDPKTGSDTLAVNSGTVSVPAQTPGAGILTRTFSNLSVAAHASLAFTSPVTHTDRAVIIVTSLSVNASTGKLDLGSNDMIIHGSAPSLVSGYNGNLWTGPGIDSSAAAGDATKRTALGELTNNSGGSTIVPMFDGQPVALNDVLIKYTYYGDANLDGTVNSLDFNALATNYGHSGATWQQGDFNYSGSIDSTDFSSLASNFGLSLL